MKYIEIDNEKKIDVSVIGRVTIDFNPVDYYNTLDKNEIFKKYVGGSAGNIVIGLNRYKRITNFISRISIDKFGKFIEDFFTEEGVSINQIQHDDKLKTGLTFTEMLNEKESNLLMYRDSVADLEIDPLLIDKQKIKNSKLMLISAVSLSKEPARSACEITLKIANEEKVPVIFDLDYRPYTWKNENEVSEQYWKIAENSSILIGSEEEFSFLLCKENDSFEKLFKKLLNKSAKIIILKKGSKGSVLYTNDGFVEIGIIKVKLLKGFGGGDAFASAFIDSLLEDQEDLIKALSRATAAASIVVSHHSSSIALPNKEELDKFIKENKFIKLPEWIKL